MSKQFRLTMPDSEAEGLIEQAKMEGFDTPQQLILHQLRRFSELEAENTQLNAAQDVTIEEMATSKTQEVLEIIKAYRHELLMLYAFRYLFPEVPADVVDVMTAYKLTPGVYYMQHVCQKFPAYIEQIKAAAKRAAKAETENAQLKQSVRTLESERAGFEQKYKAAETLESAMDMVLRNDAHIEQLCQKLHIRLIGNTSFHNAVDDMLELGGTSRHQDYVSRALRSYHVYKREDVEGQLTSAQAVISTQAGEIADLKHERDFHKQKSWLRKVWEAISGRVTLPKPLPRTADDDDIPF